MPSRKWQDILAAGAAGRQLADFGRDIGSLIGPSPEERRMRGYQVEDRNARFENEAERDDERLRRDLVLAAAFGNAPGVRATPGDRVPGLGFVSNPKALPVTEGQMQSLSLEDQAKLMPEPTTPLVSGAYFSKKAQAEDNALLQDLEDQKSQRTLDRRLKEIKAMGEAGLGRVGRGGITENQKTSILMRAGKAGLDINDERYKNEAGEIDYSRVAFEAGAGERQRLNEERQAKLATLPAASKEKVAAYYAVQDDLARLRETLSNVAASGQIPGTADNAIAVALAKSPTGFFSSLYQQGLQNLQGANSQQIERVRGAVSAAIGRAVAGAALTDTEKQNLIPFTPQAGDSFERLVEKAAALENFLNNQIRGFSTPVTAGPPRGESVPGPSQPSSQSVGRFKIIAR